MSDDVKIDRETALKIARWLRTNSVRGSVCDSWATLLTPGPVSLRDELRGSLLTPSEADAVLELIKGRVTGALDEAAMLPVPEQFRKHPDACWAGFHAARDAVEALFEATS